MKAKPPSKPKTHLHLHQEEPQNPSEFSFAVARIAVSQICQSVGYKATQLSALNALTVVATKYLEAIAKSASSSANTSNRTQSNLLDLTLALHHLVTLHTSTLFSISSSGGGIIRDLADFVSFHDEIPFAKPIPRPQITSIPSWASSSSSSHVPKWLPKFPDSVISCSVNERKCGERLWEDSVLGGGGIETECSSTSTSNVIEQEKLKEGKLELDLERTEKVRFRITTTRGRGGGGGGLRRVCREEKRVCWNHHNHHYNNKNITNNSINDDDVLDGDDDDQSNGIFDDEGLQKSGFKRKRRW